MICFEIEPGNIGKVLKNIETLLINLDKKLKFRIMLICEEVITNQIKHTDFEGKRLDMTVCLDLDNQRDTTLFFKDNAKKFNLMKKKEPDITKSLEETQLGGLGIFMIKKYSKNISFRYKNGYNILKVNL